MEAESSSATSFDERRRLGPRGGFKFGAKAETLERLQPLVARGNFLEVVTKIEGLGDVRAVFD